MIIGNIRLVKNFIVSCSGYRRMMKESLECFDFSLDALVEQYQLETYGKSSIIRNTTMDNEFTVGKKVLNITLSAMEKI